MRKSILVCDDERHILRLLEVNLKRQGHKVFLAADGTAALQELKRSQIDILLLDETLTCPSAQEVLNDMAGIPGSDQIQVILMRKPKGDDGPSGHGPAAPVPTTPSGSPVLVISKPFDPTDLDPLFH